MINTVCFDLDGTLVDSEIVILKSFKKVFDKYVEGVSFSLEDCRQFMGPTLKQTFSSFIDNEEVVNEMIEEFVVYYKTIELDSIELFPMVKETLEYLYNNNYNICLITNKFLKSAYPSLSYLGIIDYFNDFICLDRQKYPKPDPYAIKLAMEDYQIKEENIVMIGDNNVDIGLAKSAGVKFIGVNWVPWKNEVIKENPNYMIDRMDEIIKIIEDLNGGK